MYLSMKDIKLIDISWEREREGRKRGEREREYSLIYLNS